MSMYFRQATSGSIPCLLPIVACANGAILSGNHQQYTHAHTNVVDGVLLGGG
jgi:hypothetical protein